MEDEAKEMIEAENKEGTESDVEENEESTKEVNDEKQGQEEATDGPVGESEKVSDEGSAGTGGSIQGGRTTNSEEKTNSENERQHKEEDEKTYEIGGIMKRRWKGGKEEVLVRWVGYGSEEDSWEPASAAIDEKAEAKVLMGGKFKESGWIPLERGAPQGEVMSPF